MKIKTVITLLLVCSISVQAQVRGNKRVATTNRTFTAETGKALTDMLPIRRVSLYSNGVAYIERRGFISGNAEINLSFKQSQVDDVLKSMVVLDLGQGRIGAVSYNSSAPPSAKMAEIPFSVNAQTDGLNGGLAGVLAQLQGAKVSVATSGGTAVGAILTVEKRDVPAEKDKPARQSRFLVIANENGEISSFDLAEVRSVKLLENGTVKDVNEFANATASARRRDAKTITVTSEGAGQREMIVSYTIAAPIWKTTYRVVLDQEGKPFFQGWAIVDNVSDEDWKDVKLSLVSGMPISFIQPIQQPFFRYRPVVPIPNDLKLTPQTYEPDSGEGYGSGNGSGNGVSAVVDVTDSKIQTNVSKAQVQSLPMNGRNYAQSNNFIVDGAEVTSVSTALTSGNSGITTAASGDEVGDLFEYKIDQPITVYIEYPVRQGWLLSDESPKPDITTQRYYRFKVELAAFDNKEIAISEQRALMDSYALTNLSRADLKLFLTRRYINQATKQRLEKLIDLRVQINQIDAKLEGFDNEVEKIEDDQKRLRENIEALSKTPEAKTLIARYIAKANDQETRLETIEKERKSLEAEKEQLERELITEIKNFEVQPNTE